MSKDLTENQAAKSVDSIDWLGVESAPKDGTPILGWNAFGEGSPYPHGVAAVVYWDMYHTKSWTGSVCETTHLRITHWIRLPSPPNK